MDLNFHSEFIAKLHRDLWRWLTIFAGYILHMHCPSFSWRDCGIGSNRTCGWVFTYTAEVSFDATGVADVFAC